MFRLFYDGDIWNSLDKKTLVDIKESDNPLYIQALKVALLGAEKVHPLANQYSSKCEENGCIWHVQFRAVKVAVFPNDYPIKGFAYTPMHGLDGFARVGFTQRDSDMILGVINDHSRYRLK